MSRLRAQGIQRCHLLIYADNEEAKRFWAALGWSLHEDLRFLTRGLDAD